MLNDIKPLITLILGAMIGTITGLLIAPDKGSNTRKDLAKKGKKSVDDLNNEIRKLQQKLSRITSQRKKAGTPSSSKKEESGSSAKKQTGNKAKSGTKASPKKTEGQTKTSAATPKKRLRAQVKTEALALALALVQVQVLAQVQVQVQVLAQVQVHPRNPEMLRKNHPNNQKASPVIAAMSCGTDFC